MVILLCILVSVFGISASALTPATSPKAPTGLTAAASQESTFVWKVNLEWQDTAANETGFKIYRRASAVKEYSLIDTVSANTVEYLDTSAALGRTCFYYVTAYNKESIEPQWSPYTFMLFFAYSIRSLSKLSI